jgi:hypothetical protein
VKHCWLQATNLLESDGNDLPETDFETLRQTMPLLPGASARHQLDLTPALFDVFAAVALICAHLPPACTADAIDQSHAVCCQSQLLLPGVALPLFADADLIIGRARRAVTACTMLPASSPQPSPKTCSRSLLRFCGIGCPTIAPGHGFLHLLLMPRPVLHRAVSVDTSTLATLSSSYGHGPAWLRPCAQNAIIHVAANTRTAPVACAVNWRPPLSGHSLATFSVIDAESCGVAVLAVAPSAILMFA